MATIRRTASARQSPNTTVATTRPEPAIRSDRSLVTIAALAGMGDDDQLDTYLRRAIESGLTRDQIAEAFTHLAFYAGWPKATKALAATARVLGTSSSR